jgi:thiol-disulfide isomerase/thioredoxin
MKCIGINYYINNLKNIKMKKLRLIMAALLVATSFGSFAQTIEHSENPKLIAVVNTAKWCGVCKANAARFGAVLMPYAAKGVNIYMNDITDETTKEASKKELEKANAYVAVSTIPRKGMGKMLKACGLASDKKQTPDVSGIVTFINPKTYKQVKQLSIAESDEVMRSTIYNLLK